MVWVIAVAKMRKPWILTACINVSDSRLTGEGSRLMKRLQLLNLDGFIHCTLHLWIKAYRSVIQNS